MSSRDPVVDAQGLVLRPRESKQTGMDCKTDPGKQKRQNTNENEISGLLVYI